MNVARAMTRNAVSMPGQALKVRNEKRLAFSATGDWGVSRQRRRGLIVSQFWRPLP